MQMDLSVDTNADKEVLCEEHGPFTSRNFIRNVWSSCPACSVEERVREKQAADDQLREERVGRLVRNSGLEGRFKEATFDNFKVESLEQQAALDACRELVSRYKRGEHYVSYPQGSLWLIGPPGTGKTHLGSAMVNHLIQTLQVPAQIRSAREIIRLLRSTWGGNKRADPWYDRIPQTEDEMINDMAGSGLLVLDEIGVSFGSDAEHVQLFDVLDLRYKKEYPTVILSNLPLKDLRGAMGDRVFDRMREGATVVPCQWESHRKNMRREEA
jgi:DNA replication protein DnaC